MFVYDNEFTESDWRHEADARELAELDADARDMQETPCPESVVMMEDPATTLYLAIGGEFSDAAGPIGMATARPKKSKRQAA